MKHAPADMGTPEYQRISISPTCVKPACFADSSGMFWSVNDNNMLQEAQPDSVHVPSEKSMLLAAVLMPCVCVPVKHVIQSTKHAQRFSANTSRSQTNSKIQKLSAVLQHVNTIHEI